MLLKTGAVLLFSTDIVGLHMQAAGEYQRLGTADGEDFFARSSIPGGSALRAAYWRWQCAAEHDRSSSCRFSDDCIRHAAPFQISTLLFQ